MQIYRWPQIPERPSPGEPVLVRVPVSSERKTARREVRAALCAVLTAWLGREPVLEETSHGPVCRDETFDISLSYSGSEAWIGLIYGGRIGVDVMAVESFPEMSDVARNYLGPTTTARIQYAANPARVFASAWTMREATLKCYKHSLTEWDNAELVAKTTVINDNGLTGAIAVL